MWLRPTAFYPLAHMRPGIVTRGVVLDMTKVYKKDPIPMGIAYTEADIKRAAREQEHRKLEPVTWCFCIRAF